MILKLLPDGGPIYAETNINNFIVEPFNMISAFLFVGIALYWLIRIRKEWRQFSFMTSLILLLFIGGIGGTLYHGFRSEAFYMYMDWLPILIICIMSSAYFLYKILRRWYYAAAIVIASLVLQVVAFFFIPFWLKTNVSYIMLALLLILPLTIVLKKTHYYEYQNVLYSAVFFVFAIVSRIIDPYFMGTIGTHFLWHVFGATSCFLMFRYLHKLYKYKKGSLVNSENYSAKSALDNHSKRSFS